MAQSPRRSKYYVRVARPRIETAVVEVDAVDDEEAEQRALEQATQLSEASWAIEPFDMETYRPHVDTMVAGNDFDPVVELDRGQATELLAESRRTTCCSGRTVTWVKVRSWYSLGCSSTTLICSRLISPATGFARLSNFG